MKQFGTESFLGYYKYCIKHNPVCRCQDYTGDKPLLLPCRWMIDAALCHLSHATI